MSSSYTTTTSATGMPSLDIDYRRGNASNHQEDRHSRTPSPSPKANRAKSYAGIYNRPEIRREFVKSRSFCQSSPPDTRNPLLKGYDEDDVRESIFKTELSCSDSNFADENLNDNFTDDELFELETAKNDVEMNVEKEKPESENQPEPSSVSSANPSLTCNEEQRHSLVSDAQANEGAGIVKPIPVRPDCAPSPDQRRSLLYNRKLENLSVAQVAPVRKNSRDESALRVVSNDGHGSRRGSNVSATPFTQVDWQNELTVASSMEVQERMDRLLSWEFPIFELSEKCHILTQVKIYFIFYEFHFTFHLADYIGLNVKIHYLKWRTIYASFKHKKIYIYLL